MHSQPSPAVCNRPSVGILSSVRNHERNMEFSTMRSGEPMSTRCSICKQTFVAKARPGERDDDTMLRLRMRFQAHDCNDVLEITPVD